MKIKLIGLIASAMLMGSGALFASEPSGVNPDPAPRLEVREPKALPTYFSSPQRAVVVQAPDYIPFVSIAEMIRGRVAGVQVSGAYFDYQIRIRGAMGPPLVVIDNFPFYSYNDEEINNLLWSIPVFDVAKIEILKNAADAAIYGGQAANGVIRITTLPFTENSVEE